MSDGSALAVRDLSQTESPERNGELLSAGSDWIELQLNDGGAPIPSGTPVDVQTDQTVYLGHVEGGQTSGNGRLRVRVEHWLALPDVASIQKGWSQEQAD